MTTWGEAKARDIQHVLDDIDIVSADNAQLISQLRDLKIFHQ